MERSEFLRFVWLRITVPLVFSCLLAATCLYYFTAFFQPVAFPGGALAAESQKDSIDDTWQLSLPMPGGTQESALVLATRGDTLSGTMSNPGAATDVHPIYDGIFQDGSFSLSVDIGRITYFLKGTLRGDTLSFDMETTETIPLDSGQRLKGNTNEISGVYLVPVYSPGGIMENHFELTAENGTISGQMYVPVTGNDSSPDQMAGGPPGMEAPPGDLPTGAQTGPPGGSGDASDGKRDVNTFFDGTYEGNRISLYTRTGQGSLFHFIGTVEGDAIKLTLNVTDQNEGLKAFRAE